MKKHLSAFAVLLTLAAGAGELLQADFTRLDATGKKAGFQVFRAQTGNINGQNTIILNAAKGNFVTLPVTIPRSGILTFSGLCTGDGEELYAKVVIQKKSATGSLRKKYMQSQGKEGLFFKIDLKGVPAGEGYLFISVRGKTGQLELKKISLKLKKDQVPVKITEKIHPVPGVIDSDSERIIRSAALDLSRGWEIRHPGDKRLALLPENKVTPGVLEVIFDTHTGRLETKYFPFNFRTGRLTCRLDRLIDLPPETWTKYNQLSVMAKPLCSHDRSHLWFDVLGVSGHQSAVPMKGNVWNKIAISWNNLSPEKARKITGISFGFGGFGTPLGEERYTRFLFKDFKLEQVAVGTENTWEVSPEKIVVPQTGFSPGEEKQALLSPSHKAEDFYLAANGKKVYTGRLVTETFATGSFKIARFSDFRTPGTYRLVSGNLRSVPFKIGYDHLKEAAAKSRNFMYSMRLGGTTPLFPKHAQLTDDARRSDGKAVNVSGGWCDAADLCGFHSMAATSITRPLARSIYLFNIPEMKNEAFWGGKLLNKLFDEEYGLPYTVMSHFGAYRSAHPFDRKNPDPKTRDIIQNNGEWTMNKYFTDGKPGTGDERGVHLGKIDGIFSPHDRQDFHYGLTAAGSWIYLASGKSSAFSKAFAHSRKHFEKLEKTAPQELKSDGILPFERKFTRSEFFRLENAMVLYLVTGEQKYRVLAAALVKDLLAKQERFIYTANKGRITGWFNAYRPRSTYYEGPYYASSILSLYAKLMAQPEEYLQITAALRIYGDGCTANKDFRVRPYNMLYPILSLRPFKHWSPRVIGTRGKLQLYANFRKIFLSHATGAMALDNMAAAAFLNDVKLQYAASELLRYHLGENQSARSLMTDTGVNFNRQLMSTNFGWISGMMGNPDIQNGTAQLPYNRNCGRYEVYTQAQGGYTAALTVLSSPALLTFEGEKKITLTDTLTGKVHTADNGKFSLPGGTVYRVSAPGYPLFDLPVISGEKKTLKLDRSRPFIANFSKKGNGTAVTVINPSAKTTTVKLNVYAENADFSGTSLTLAPGQSKEISLPCPRKNPAMAAAAVIYLDDHVKEARSLML